LCFRYRPKRKHGELNVSEGESVLKENREGGDGPS